MGVFGRPIRILGLIRGLKMIRKPSHTSHRETGAGEFERGAYLKAWQLIGVGRVQLPSLLRNGWV